MKIIPGMSSQLLAARIATELGGNVSLCEFKKFPDGESYTRVLDDIKDEEVTIVQSIITDSDLICLLQLIDAVEEAHETTVVIPYLGYARQDKKFKPGDFLCASSSEVVSSIKPIDAFTGRSSFNSALLSTPKLQCGSNPRFIASLHISFVYSMREEHPKETRRSVKK
ncbi:MAG: ribose-phosphate pyrophosphokinase-like domain-containing protein [Halobacteriota archaeon]